MASKRVFAKMNRKPKFRICRQMLRELALQGMIPGMRKASW